MTLEQGGKEMGVFMTRWLIFAAPLAGGLKETRRGSHRKKTGDRENKEERIRQRLRVNEKKEQRHRKEREKRKRERERGREREGVTSTLTAYLDPMQP